MSDKINYLVTLATGSTGNQVARQLLDKGYKVRVMARTKGAAIDELVSLGAEMTLGHMHIKEDLDRALKGIHRVFYCHTVGGGRPARCHRAHTSTAWEAWRFAFRPDRSAEARRRAVVAERYTPRRSRPYSARRR